MKNINEDTISINDNLLIFDVFITLFLFAELIGTRHILNKRTKNFFNKTIDGYEETINLDGIEEKLNEDYLKDLYCGEIILKYCHTLINTLDKENLQTFYHNINTLKTCAYKNNLRDILKGGIVGGRYNPNNSILVVEKLKYALPHELTHMASTIVKDNGFALCGFHQIKDKKGYGYGINEGYTQYFTEKHFLDSFPDIPKAYTLEVEIAKKLTCVIGEKEMENLYFHANLKGLIDSISYYSSLEDAKDFIAAVDFVKIFIYHIPKSKELYKMLEIKLQKINTILLKCFLNKQKEERLKGISSQELKEEEEEFDNYLGDELTLEMPFKTKVLNISIPLEAEKSLRKEIK